jgi:mannosyltransferase OCH1-like enzyme
MWVLVVAIAVTLTIVIALASARARSIPRVMHQTHGVPFHELPGVFKRNARRLIRENPTFEYRYYSARDCEAFIRSRYGEEMLSIYLSIDPAYGPARSDLFRYMLLYEEGGVYFDMKSGPNVPLDQIIRPNDSYLLSNWCGGECGRANWDALVKTGFGEYQQWWIACAPRHPFLRAVISQCVRNIDAYVHTTSPSTFGKLGVLALTGPIAYTRAIHPLVEARSASFRFVPRSLGGAVTYNRTGVDHAKVYASHYSTLRTPIVTPLKTRNRKTRKTEKDLNKSTPFNGPKTPGVFLSTD